MRRTKQALSAALASAFFTFAWLTAPMTALAAEFASTAGQTERARALEHNASLASGIEQGRLLARAGRAWLLAGQAARADDTQTRALATLPGDTALYIDRSFARRILGKSWDALDDLHRALDLDPGNAEALVFRAELYRALGQRDLALDDLERALAVNPSHPEALYRRGEIRKLAGDWVGARADWVHLIARAPQSPAAGNAQTALRALDQSASLTRQRPAELPAPR
ncbi:MAG: tetratricopeptide repeat protein [Alphaproteobacteria bacterium]